MDNPVLRLDRRNVGKVLVTEIQGVNIYTMNGADHPPNLDPKLQLLDFITMSECSWAGVVGELSLSDRLDTFDELVRDRRGVIDSWSSNIGLHLGDFYVSEQVQDGHFWIGAGPIVSAFAPEPLAYIARLGGIAVCVSACPQDDWAWTRQRMSERISDEELVDALTPQVGFLMAMGHDGMTADVYTRSANLPDMVRDAMDYVGDSVYRSEWFRENEPRLIWDIDEQCLMLRN